MFANDVSHLLSVFTSPILSFLFFAFSSTSYLLPRHIVCAPTIKTMGKCILRSADVRSIAGPRAGSGSRSRNVIGEQCTVVYCVDLRESFQTNSLRANSAFIPPRASPVKFARREASPRSLRSEPPTERSVSSAGCRRPPRSAASCSPRWLADRGHLPNSFKLCELLG